MIEQRNDVVGESIANLGPSFWGKPIITSIMFAFALEFQRLEDAIFEVIEKRLLDNAVAAQLETIGAIVGEPRYDRTDDEYRVAIRGRILSNLSDATRNDLNDLLNLMRPVETYSYDEGEADITIYTSSTDHDLDQVALPFLRDAAAAGVSVNMIASADSDDSLVLGDALVDPVFSSTECLGSTTEAGLGGDLATIL